METNWCILEIDENNMWAKLALKLPESDEIAPISADYIENFVKEQGISSGINKDAITALSETLVYGQFIEVASGKPAIDGANGYYSFLIPIEDAKAKPVINEDGSADYYNSLRLAMVSEGEQIAKYNPATKGEYGHDIYSKLINPTPGKDLPPLKGTGFTTNEEKNEYFAAYNGHIMFKDGSINIERIFIVEGDLDIDTGNISFNGDVEVRGDVRSGLAIRADGNIFIQGHVGACYIGAKGSITIKEGIQGRNKCTIKADKDVVCKFVERCTITAGGSIYADSILDSDVFANNEVNVVSHNGVVIGGTTYGMNSVNIKEAGNDSETPTLIMSGPTKEDILNSADLTLKINKYSNDIAQLDAQLKKYDAINTTDEATRDKIILLRHKVMRGKLSLVAEMKTHQLEVNEINKRINEARAHALVHITGISHPGVKIGIENNYFTVTEAFKDVVYKVNMGTIEATPGDS